MLNMFEEYLLLWILLPVMVIKKDLHKNCQAAYFALNYYLKDLLKNIVKKVKKVIKKNCFSHPSINIRREILDNYGLYDEKYLYAQDYELWCRLLYKYNLKGKNLAEKLIVMNIPIERLLEKNTNKFIIQRRNSIKTKLKYLKYSL